MKINTEFAILLGFCIIAILLAPSFVFAQYSNCTYHASQKCAGSYLYWYDSCGNPQELIEYCPNGCYGNSCQNYTGCTNHAYQKCLGNYLYWYDACGNQQDLAEFCQQGCNVNSCVTSNGNNPDYNYNYNSSPQTCTNHAYKLCIGNSIYWYNSCGNQQELANTCSGGQVCQYGYCATAAAPAPNTQNIQPIGNYVAHSGTNCYNNSLYWYDSSGVFNDLFQTCGDENSCTQDGCTGDICANILLCDGSTCSQDSNDYNMYCAPNIVSPNSLSVTFLVKQALDSEQWDKSITLNADNKAYFMLSIANNSNIQADNVRVSVGTPGELSLISNLRLGGIPISGDIKSEVNIGSIGPATSKVLTFEVETGSISESSSKQVIATANVSENLQSDSITLNFTASQASTASISDSTGSSGIWEFIKSRYFWIIGGVVLVFLFIVVFRRLSTEN